MRGYIYNNPKLANEDDGYWCFEPNKPHDYWCVLREMEDDLVLLVPVWFDLMDNLPNSVVESCPIQMSDGIMNITIGVGRCVHRLKTDLTTEPTIFMNPEWAKKAYKVVARMCKGD
jgi:hypothetical protein